MISTVGLVSNAHNAYNMRIHLGFDFPNPWRRIEQNRETGNGSQTLLHAMHITSTDPVFIGDATGSSGCAGRTFQKVM